MSFLPPIESEARLGYLPDSDPGPDPDAQDAGAARSCAGRMGRRAACCTAVAALCSPLGTLAALAEAPEAVDPLGSASARWAWTDPLPKAWAAAATDQGPAMDTSDAAAPAEYRWRGPVPTQPDYRGAGRDLAYFLSYQIVAVGVLYLMPESVSRWSDEDKSKFSFEKWRYNVTNPRWDNDAFYINYVLHPYWGGSYYVRARERGLGRTESFWFSALMSASYEYGAEALAEPVSYNDLIVTPVLGSLLGEYVFTPWRDHIRAKPGELDFWDKVVLVATDPLGAINAQIDSWLGVKSSVQFGPGALRYPGGRGFAGASPLGMGPPGLGPSSAGVAGAGAYAADPAWQTRKSSAGWNVQARIEW